MKKRFLQTLFAALFCLAISFCFSSCSLFQDSNAHEHTYTAKELSKPTCTEEGFILHTCECGEQSIETVQAIGHEFLTYFSNDNATCETNATETATCTRDGCTEQDVREIENTALGHSFLDYHFDKPTGTTFTKTSVCSRDHCEKTDTIPSNQPPYVLVYTSNMEDAEAVNSALTDQYYITTVVQTDHANNLPTTLKQLEKFEQVVFVNIANADIPNGFDTLLATYVENGGSFFTVGGDNAYDRSDMYGTLYQEMLPVQAIQYTPPIAVMIVMDTSGSMSMEDNNDSNKLDRAKAGATSCVESLTEHDYVGIMTMESVESVVLDLTPRTQESRILSAIHSIAEANGGTIWTGAIDRAGKALRAMQNVSKRHIIVITDGAIGEEPFNYEGLIKEYYQDDGITLSVVGVDMETNSREYEQMLEATQWGGGKLYVTSPDQLTNRLHGDLMEDANKAFTYSSFKPTIAADYATLYQVSQNDMPILDGFYCSNLKTGATAILSGVYNMPIYAEWNYGKGRVGSFMCDLNGTWTNAFLASQTGRQVLNEMLKCLMFE